MPNNHTRTVKVKQNPLFNTLCIEFKLNGKIVRKGTYHNYFGNGDMLARQMFEWVQQGLYPQEEIGMEILVIN